VTKQKALFLLLGYLGGSHRENLVVKASKLKTGAKIRKGRPVGADKKEDLKSKALVTPKPRIEDMEIEYFTRPIYAFPSFDKSDSLIFLPSTLSRHMNSGDMQSASKLLLSHMDKDCAISMVHQAGEFGKLMNTRLLVKMIELVSDIHPDSITCVHQTKVDGNCIMASIYAKFTDIKQVRDSVHRTIQEPVLRSLIGHSRQDGVQRLIGNDGLSDDQQQEYLSLAATEQDLLVYIHVDLALTVDDMTKKINHFKVNVRTTSMHVVPDGVGRGRDEGHAAICN